MLHKLQLSYNLVPQEWRVVYANCSLCLFVWFGGKNCDFPLSSSVQTTHHFPLKWTGHMTLYVHVHWCINANMSVSMNVCDLPQHTNLIVSAFPFFSAALGVIGMRNISLTFFLSFFSFLTTVKVRGHQSSVFIHHIVSCLALLYWGLDLPWPGSCPYDLIKNRSHLAQSHRHDLREEIKHTGGQDAVSCILHTVWIWKVDWLMDGWMETNALSQIVLKTTTFYTVLERQYWSSRSSHTKLSN